MKELFTKKHYTAVIVSLVFICNPNFHTVDILPDFIGYLMMALAIGHAADIAPYFQEMRTALFRLTLITFVKMPATLVMYGNLHAGRDIVPLFVLVFSILELICLIPLISNAYGGLTYLGQRSEVGALLAPVSLFGRSITPSGIRFLTMLFVILKAALNTLPTVCLLTYTDANMAHMAQNMYAPLEIINISVVLIAGILWCLIATKYVKAVRNEGGIAEGLLAMAGEMRLGEIERKITMRGLLGGVTILFASSFLTFNIALEQTGYINILPRYFLVFVLFLAFYKLSGEKHSQRRDIITGAIAAATALIYQVVTIVFFNKYSYLDILENRLAKEMYAWVEAFSVIETVALLAFLVSLAFTLYEIIRRHTGMSPDEEGYSRASMARHGKLMRKGVILLSMYALTAIGSCVCVFLWGNAHSEFTEGADGVIDIMAEPAASWFGTVVFAFCIVLLIYSYMYTNELRDEIRMRYDINL